ncbi:MAG: hypothetical protein ABIJ46_04110 [bacterium]
MNERSMTWAQFGWEVFKNLAWLAGFGAFIVAMWWALAPASPM